MKHKQALRKKQSLAAPDMKIRMKENTLRLRLSQLEVEEFKRQGKVSTITRLGPSSESFLRYSLQKDGSAKTVVTTFRRNEIIVLVPAKLADEWALTDKLGFEEQIPLNGKDHLYVLVEKDFQCLHKRPHEDETDSFPNPLENNC